MDTGAGSVEELCAASPAVPSRVPCKLSCCQPFGYSPQIRVHEKVRNEGSMSRYSIFRSTLAVFAVMIVGCVWASRAGAQTAAINLSAEQASAAPPAAQLVQPLGPGQTSAPVVITLKDALEHAQKVDPSIAAAGADAKSAH